MPSLKTDVLDSILEKYVKIEEDGSVQNLLAAGLVVSGRNGEVLYSNAAGRRNFDADSPAFSLDTVCWVASISKLVTAVSVMQVVEKGLIGLDTDVRGIVPQLADKEILTGFDDDGKPILSKATKPITLRNLVTHTAGMCYDEFDPAIIKWGQATGRTVTSNAHTLESLDFPLLFEPGDGWVYGVGTDWAGRVIEVLCDCTLEEHMQQNIFQPLGMSSTTFQPWNRPELTARRAALAARPTPDSPLVPADGQVPHDTAMDKGGSGLFSTANDFIKLLTAILDNDGRLLKPESVKELFTPQLADPKPLHAFWDGIIQESICPEFPVGLPVNFGLGGAVNLEDAPGNKRQGSLTWLGLTNVRWFIDPTSGIAVTLFTQLVPFGDKVFTSLYSKIEKAVYESVS